MTAQSTVLERIRAASDFGCRMHFDAKFSPNSAHVACVGVLGNATLPSLYLSKLPCTGNPSDALQVTSGTSPAVQADFAWLPGSRVLIYRANDPGGAQLHATHITSTGTVGTAVNTSGAFGAGIASYQFEPTR